MPSELALSFGNVAELYDRVRLGYSEEAVDLLCSKLGLDPKATVLDLAAGTGKLTASLRERFARVAAVEPNGAMRALIDGGDALAGTAERIPLPDASVDVVFVADAFHWFEGPAALAEIARVLRPRGGLALIWNRWWETEPRIPEPALELLDELYQRSGAPSVAAADWRDAFAESSFEPLREQTLQQQIEVDANLLVDLYLTTSSIAALDARERAATERELRRLLEGTYRLPLAIELAWTRRR